MRRSVRIDGENSIRRPGGETGRTGRAAAERRRAARASRRRDGGSRHAQVAANSTEHSAQPCKSALRCPRSAIQLRYAPAVMPAREAYSCGRGRLSDSTQQQRLCCSNGGDGGAACSLSGGSVASGVHPVHRVAADCASAAVQNVTTGGRRWG